MVYNKRGGNKAKRSKNSRGKISGRSLRTKDNSIESTELYGKVTKRCGGNPPILDVTYEDGVDRRCVLRGKFTKKIWVYPGDIVLLEPNKESFQPPKLW